MKRVISGALRSGRSWGLLVCLVGLSVLALNRGLSRAAAPNPELAGVTKAVVVAEFAIGDQATSLAAAGPDRVVVVGPAGLWLAGSTGVTAPIDLTGTPSRVFAQGDRAWVEVRTRHPTLAFEHTVEIVEVALGSQSVVRRTLLPQGHLIAALREGALVLDDGEGEFKLIERESGGSRKLGSVGRNRGHLVEAEVLGGRIYVCQLYPGGVWAIQLDASRPVEEIRSPRDLNDLVVFADHALVIASSTESTTGNDVGTLELKTGALSLSEEPTTAGKSLALAPTGDGAIVLTADALVVLDAAGEIRGRVPLPAGPWDSRAFDYRDGVVTVLGGEGSSRLHRFRLE
tara:strand:- start:52 stop:1083 length:1032 start_codon:yes stop_codon:yes gene_type:complete